MRLADHLRQMLALLEDERQALADLDLERIITCASGKEQICHAIEGLELQSLDEECSGLLSAVHHLNDINRKLRNMIAANIQSRLGALSGQMAIYGRKGAALAGSLSL